MACTLPESVELRDVWRVLEAIRDNTSPHERCGLSERQASKALRTGVALGLLERLDGEYRLPSASLELLRGNYAAGETLERLREAITRSDFVRSVVPDLWNSELTKEVLTRRLETHEETALEAQRAAHLAASLIKWRLDLTSAAAPSPNNSQALLLHLSDIHLTEHAAENPILGRASAISKCIRAHFTIGKPSACIIVLTGDIAQSGRQEEYVLASSLMADIQDGLARELGVPVALVMVPGNHDCDFSSTAASVRGKLLNGLTVEQVDHDMFAAVSLPQDKFRAFAKSHETPLTIHFDGIAAQSCSLSIGNCTIRFDKYNTAWCSTIREQQGALLLPIPQFPGDLPECDAIIAMFHHPLGWLDADNARALRDHLDKTADIVTTGHEHSHARYSRLTEGGAHTEHLEGMVLQSRVDRARSGFSTLLVDFEHGTQRSTLFAWSEGAGSYVLQDEFQPRAFQRTKVRARNRFPISECFAQYLSDPGDPHKHPKKRTLTLEDIFVYPELQPHSSRESCTKVIKDPLEHVIKERRVLILGDEFSGKTSLAKKLFVDLHREGRLPLLCRGQSFRDASEGGGLRTTIADAVKEIYGATHLESYLQEETANKILIIDDADKSCLATDLFASALANVAPAFGCVVALASSEFIIALLGAGGERCRELLAYETSSIQPFGRVRRYRLVEQWCHLGRGADEEVRAISLRTQRLNQLIDKAMGSSLLPGLPGLILLCLQQVEAFRGTEIADGSFGHLYNALITANLDGGGSAVDIGAKRKFLGMFAEALYSSHADSMSVVDWERLYQLYVDRHDARYPRNDFFKELHGSGLILLNKETVSFRYKYPYCFFVADYLWRTKPSSAVREAAISLCAELHNTDSASILLFLVHLDRESTVRDVLMDHARSLAPLSGGFDLHKALQPLGMSPVSSLTLVADTVEARRVKQHEDADELSRRANATRGGLPPELLEFVSAFRVVHILGQTLKGATGTMEAEPKAMVLAECFDLSQRTVAKLIGKLVAHHHQLAAEVGALLVEQRPELENDLGEIQTRVLTWLYSLCVALVYGAAIQVSDAAGTASLRGTYDRLLKNEGENQIYRLFDMAIRLDHLEAFPQRELDALESRFCEKPAIKSVLRRLIYRHLCFFDVDHRIRQRLCQKYDISGPRVLVERKRTGTGD